MKLLRDKGVKKKPCCYYKQRFTCFGLGKPSCLFFTPPTFQLVFTKIQDLKALDLYLSVKCSCITFHLRVNITKYYVSRYHRISTNLLYTWPVITFHTYVHLHFFVDDTCMQPLGPDTCCYVKFHYEGLTSGMI